MRCLVVVLSVWSVGLVGCSGGNIDSGQFCLSGSTNDGALVIGNACIRCHSASVTGVQRNGAPDGVNFDNDTELRRFSDRIRLRAVEQGTMPPNQLLLDCDRTALASYLDALAQAPCTADCSGRVCGHDGCTGSCGDCGAGERCDLAVGQCVSATCVPACGSRVCGDDGCGGSCGSCTNGMGCDANGTCACTLTCNGRQCGDDGCGGSCGSCGTAGTCDNGTCLCTPSCAGKECGDNGCSGSCGTCVSPDTCSANGMCECVPSCGTKVCGDDGCGGSCGTCQGNLLCSTRDGTCNATCTPDCSGRACGDDGCGGSCGTCTGATTCDGNGQCACTPNCVGIMCGDDGCGGSCGTCTGASTCDGSGQCVCQPDCSGRACGSNGCGGSCGSCGSDQACDGSGQCVCAPTCPADWCGDDGCGGTCGPCASGQQCVSSTCEWPPASFINDVWPMLMSNGCTGGMCHGGVAPKEGLDMNTAQTAYASLVDAASTECSNKKRVAPGAPDQSYLINKVTGVGMCFGTRMPKMGTVLTNTQIDVIRAWIGNGALNN